MRPLPVCARWPIRNGATATIRVLVCVHGLTRNGRDFDALATALAPHYRIVCPDVVGRGRSEWLKDGSGYGFPQYVADMMVLIARLGVDNVHRVGTSMGGLIGMIIANQSDLPISRLVLNDVSRWSRCSVSANTSARRRASPISPKPSATSVWSVRRSVH
jgi:pimeloyl-ACP methyl ester carboxylesterase